MLVKVKLDENLGVRSAAILQEAGCDASTVVGENLCSSSDEALLEVCRRAGRALVTLDKDFSGILRFPPEEYRGIVVLRLPEPLTPTVIEDALRRFVVAARGVDLGGRLWVIDVQRIREFERPE